MTQLAQLTQSEAKCAKSVKCAKQIFNKPDKIRGEWTEKNMNQNRIAGNGRRLVKNYQYYQKFLFFLAYIKKKL